MLFGVLSTIEDLIYVDIQKNQTFLKACLRFDKLVPIAQQNHNPQLPLENKNN